MPEKIPTPEESGHADPEGVWRIEARPVEEARTGKKELVPYEEVRRLMFEPPIPMPVYEEFDAAKSFADLKEEVGAMQDLPPDVRRGRIRARIGEIREHLARQEQGIAEAIRALQSAIEKIPTKTAASSSAAWWSLLRSTIFQAMNCVSFGTR